MVICDQMPPWYKKTCSCWFDGSTYVIFNGWELGAKLRDESKRSTFMTKARVSEDTGAVIPNLVKDAIVASYTVQTTYTVYASHSETARDMRVVDHDHVGAGKVTRMW